MAEHYRSLVRILNQMENLHEYFLGQLPRQKGFNGKNGLSKNDRFQRICSMLKNKEAEVCMSFVIYLARDFSRFMVPLQTSAPMIHRLYSMCLHLVHALMGKVIREEHTLKNGRHVSFSKLRETDLQKKDVQKVCDFRVLFQV